MVVATEDAPVLTSLRTPGGGEACGRYEDHVVGVCSDMRWVPSGIPWPPCPRRCLLTRSSLELNDVVLLIDEICTLVERSCDRCCPATARTLAAMRYRWTRCRDRLRSSDGGGLVVLRDYCANGSAYAEADAALRGLVVFRERLEGGMSALLLPWLVPRFG